MSALPEYSLPGPRALPGVGSTWNYLQFFRDPIGTLRRHQRVYGPLSGLSAPLHPGVKGTLLAIGAEYNQQVLSNTKVFHAFQMRAPTGSAAERLGTGVVYLNGEHHRQQRRLIMPAFHKKELDHYAGDMIEQTRRLLDSWRPGQTLNLIEEMTRLTLNVVVKTLFGLDAEANGRELGALLEDWLALGSSLGANLIPASVPGSPARRLLHVAEQIEAKTIELLARKRATLAESRDVISMLMRTHDEDGAQMTDAEVIGNAVVLYLAGHETSANALSWALFLLAQHPNVMADLLDELESNLHGEPPGLEQLGKLRLLEGVINEALRLFPPLAYILKNAAEPFEMGGHEFPAGSSVMLSHFMTHRLPEIYEQPDRFMPERWLKIDPSPYEYIPFSAGPRLCIGATFAMMEMRFVLAMLLQRYRLAVVPNADVNASILFLLRARQVPMVVHAQDRQFSSEPVRGNVLSLVDLS